MAIKREEKAIWHLVIFGQHISVMFHDAPPSLLVLGRLIEELQEERRRVMEDMGVG